MSEETSEPIPSLADSAETPPTPGPTVIHVKSDGTGRTPIWLLLGVSLGFLLPVCACSFMMVTFFFSLGLAGTAVPTATSSGGFGDAVAIVRVEGPITHSDDTQSAIGAVSGTVVNDLRLAEADESIKAIVLRVDSPGGTVTGSAQIHEALVDLEKPVVVSMAGTAASGGYYISAPADYIFARADTTTGSLGVVLTLYNVTELMNKVGVDVTSITSGPNKTMGNPWEPLTAEQEAILQSFADEAYDGFVQVIVDGRALPEEEVRQLADGRIYSGSQALALGLIDELGNLEDAIAKAAALGGISGEPRIVEYEHLPRFQDFLASFAARMSKSEAEQTMELVNSLVSPSLEYRYIGPGAK
jgi:protease-4